MKPQALVKFIHALQGSPPGSALADAAATWEPFNVSLFHYRNYGSDFVTVLAGIQVAPHRAHEFERLLVQLGYQYADESLNPVYTRFLK